MTSSPQDSGLIRSALPSRGTFSDFLADLRAFESGIDPLKFDWYVENYHSPVMSYPKVSSPGRAARDVETGELLFVPMTVAEYFESLGVSELFTPDTSECVSRMQYRVVNALGFVGYQVGEAILITTGYYEPEHVPDNSDGVTLERYYAGAADTALWKNGHREARFQLGGTDKWIITTDVNCWQGTFTGKDGIRSFADLLQPEKQDLVMREILRTNYRCICDELETRDTSLQRVLQTLPTSTLSGTLAAAHLCGPYAVVEMFLSGNHAKDEFGTSMLQYLNDFAGYDIPYDLSR